VAILSESAKEKLTKNNLLNSSVAIDILGEIGFYATKVLALKLHTDRGGHNYAFSPSHRSSVVTLGFLLDDRAEATNAPACANVDFAAQRGAHGQWLQA
jgi:hypothetical protein